MDKWKGRALGSILFDSEMITQDDIERALDEQRRSGVRFGEALVKLGKISTEDLNWGLAQQFNIPFVHIRPEMIDPEAVRLVPEELARRYNLLPYLLIGDELTVIMEDPTVKRAVNELESVTGKHVTIGVGLPETIQVALNEVYGEWTNGGDLNLEFTPGLFDEKQTEQILTDYTSETLIRYLFAAANQRHATSIHFEPQPDSCNIRFRIGGRLEQAAHLSRSWARGCYHRLKSNLCYTQHRKGMVEGFCNVNDNGAKYFFHATFVDTPLGETGTLINLTVFDTPSSVEELIDDEAEQNLLQDILSRRSGLLFLAGTDRIEKYKFLELLLTAKGAQQQKTILVGRLPWFVDTGYTHLRPNDERWEEVQETIKFSLSQDPDLLVLEDLTRTQLLNTVLAEAVAPHFIIGNLRFVTALSALEYLLEAAENRTVFCAATRAIVSCALFQTLCPQCKQPDDRAAQASKILGVSRAEVDRSQFMKAPGCDACHGSGHNGRRWLVEILPINEPVAALLKSGEPFTKLAPQLRELHAESMEIKARKLVLAGEIGIDEYASVLGISRNATN